MAIATLTTTVLDCPEPRELAAFYATVLGGELEDDGKGDWVQLVGPDRHVLAFQRSAGYQPPSWPSTEHGQQLHLDLHVPRAEWDAAERRVLELGATLLESDHGKRDWRVYADPAGHPFCLCVG
ncbi:VOC family protein [Streptomyces profundus]|uniref:VOC family protein n=1 Tax=Streptomyces profundus TaxID=2867410 RepID=UPI001D16A941|nr:VOC family protein [Streptomyces sp. MA3_2.13]UED85989.1 VOC family protein [Streptomyces sp. MA3_2.13]